MLLPVRFFSIYNTADLGCLRFRTGSKNHSSSSDSDRSEKAQSRQRLSAFGGVLQDNVGE